MVSKNYVLVAIFTLILFISNNGTVNANEDGEQAGDSESVSGIKEYEDEVNELIEGEDSENDQEKAVDDPSARLDEEVSEDTQEESEEIESDNTEDEEKNSAINEIARLEDEYEVQEDVKTELETSEKMEEMSSEVQENEVIKEEKEDIEETNIENDLDGVDDVLVDSKEELEGTAESAEMSTLTTLKEVVESEADDQIKEIQDALVALGYLNHVTGKADELTSNAIERFQGYYNYRVTGLADEDTLNNVRTVLNQSFKSGDYHEEVIKLKTDLSYLGYHISNNPTTFYGQQTAHMVQNFQRDFDLMENGIADKITLWKLKELLDMPMQNGLYRNDVVELKVQLDELGFTVSSNPTPLFGSATETKVREFQQYYGLDVTGVADDNTTSKISEILSSPFQVGFRHQDTIKLKEDLSYLGYNISTNPTTLYGTKTEEVIMLFQSDNKLVANGIADSVTLAKLNELLNLPMENGLYREDVIQLKVQLDDVGFKVSNNPTPLFGSTTESKVREFQQYYGLNVTGVADEPTLTKLNAILSSPFRVGIRHEDTITLKEDLANLGYHISSNPTALYGAQTEETVRAFQLDNNLNVNGIADGVTMAKILELNSMPLQNGLYRQDVIELKRNLETVGFRVSANATPLYGDITEARVREFQQYYGLEVTGSAGSNTLAKLNEVLSSPLRNGQSHESVIKLKEDLAWLGYPISANPTAFYGNTTEARIREFQSNNGLRVNGIGDEVTLNKIAELFETNKFITNTLYNVTLNEAIQKQLTLNPPPQTDLYRNHTAFLHSSVVDVVETGATTASSVRLRTSPDLSNSGNIHSTVGQGTTFTILREVTGDAVSNSRTWYEITYDNLTLYVHSSLARHTQKAVVKGNNVNVRESSSTTSHIYGQVNSGAEYVVLKEVSGPSVNGSNVWYEVNYNAVWRNAKVEDFSKYIDPEQNDIFQHLMLNNSAGVSAAQLNNVLSDKGILDGKGQSFIDAGKTHGVNEVYLISHALLESGHGSSQLSTGIEVGKNRNGELVLVTTNNRRDLTDIKRTYNMFGIGAHDVDPYRLGAIEAYNRGWFTPEAAIIGGAAFISNSYFERGQNTLYKMRWNHFNSHAVGPQYATDMGWAVKQVNTIKNIYDMLDRPIYRFDVVTYK
ncbi:peptidoglycan-binding protein [Alteribacter aurantiacus]|uniref:peptidoglycan-binding protein n=1 Tax=Alteribacter aurantiacus TaxID=254410 RepID=UPI00041CC400|nr:peptidoglycan-binding protein [Alteribacter aurantiacus]